MEGEPPAIDTLGPETASERARRESQAAIAGQFVQMRNAGTHPGLMRRALEWIASGFRREQEKDSTGPGRKSSS